MSESVTAVFMTKSEYVLWAHLRRQISQSIYGVRITVEPYPKPVMPEVHREIWKTNDDGSIELVGVRRESAGFWLGEDEDAEIMNRAGRIGFERTEHLRTSPPVERVKDEDTRV